VSRVPSVVVIGGGALGLCTAWHLLARGVGDVVVVERTFVAGASSGLSVGIIETQYLDRLSIAVRVNSMRFFAELEQRGVLDIVRNGYLRLGHSQDDLAAFRASAAIQAELSVADAVVLEPGAITCLVPPLRTDDLAGGLFGPSDGYIDGHQYCNALAADIRARGGTITSNCRVIGHRKRSGRHVLVTATGEIACDIVVNAAGGWAGHVGELLDAPVEIVPQLHRALVVHLPVAVPYVMPSVMDYLPSSGAYGVYFRDDGPGRLIAGLHTEERLHAVVDPDHPVHGSDQEYVELVAAALVARAPGLGDARLGDVWSGMYPMSGDGKPIVGPHPSDGTVVVVAGAGGSGLQSSPGLGLTAAEWIVDGQPRTIAGAEAMAPR
jgi:sarcosine oxidase, subunit beta